MLRDLTVRQSAEVREFDRASLVRIESGHGFAHARTLIGGDAELFRVVVRYGGVGDDACGCVVARADLPVGTVLRAEHLAAKKPGTGIPAGRVDEVIGAHLRRSVKADQVLTEADIERGTQ